MINHIDFSEDKSSFCFVFSDKSKSQPFYSKEKGLKAAAELSENKKINSHEYSIIRDKIIRARKLPWPEPEKNLSHDGENHNSRAREILSLYFTKEEVEDIMILLDDNFKKPCLKMCPYDKKYARIYFKNGCTQRVERKIDALASLFFLRKAGIVTQDELFSIEKEIAESPLR